MRGEDRTRIAETELVRVRLRMGRGERSDAAIDEWLNAQTESMLVLIDGGSVDACS